MVRQVVTVVVTIVQNIVPNGLDLLFGFLAWPPKKMRVHLFILMDPLTSKPIISPAQLTASIDFAKTTFEDKFNVKLLKYFKRWAQELQDTSPADAL